jgi:hypothetical protein
MFWRTYFHLGMLPPPLGGDDTQSSVKLSKNAFKLSLVFDASSFGTRTTDMVENG